MKETKLGIEYKTAMSDGNSPDIKISDQLLDNFSRQNQQRSSRQFVPVSAEDFARMQGIQGMIPEVVPTLPPVPEHLTSGGVDRRIHGEDAREVNISPVDTSNLKRIYDFEESLKTKRMGEFVVLGVSPENGETLIVQNPKTGERFNVNFNVSGAEVNVAGLGNPSAAEIANPGDGSDYVDRYLVPEENKEREKRNEEISRTLEAALVANIQLMDPLFRDELIRLTESRVRYHNAAFKAADKPAEFAHDFVRVNAESYDQVWHRPGFHLALTHMLAGDGAALRQDDVVFDAWLGEYHLGPPPSATGLINTLITTPPGSSPSDAILDAKLALDHLHLLGISAELNGVVNTDGDLEHFDTSEQVTNHLIENWGKIDFAESLSGQGAKGLRDVFFFALWLEKEGNGREKDRKFYSLNVGSVMQYMQKQAVREDLAASGVTVNTMNDLIARINHPKVRNHTIAWAKMVSDAARNAEQLKKHDVLKEPIKSARSINRENYKEKLNEVFGNIDGAYPLLFGHLPTKEMRGGKAFNPREEAFVKYVTGILLNNDVVRYNWGATVKYRMIQYFKEKGYVGKASIEMLEKSLGTSGHAEDVAEAGAEVVKGVEETGKKLWSKIFGGK